MEDNSTSKLEDYCKLAKFIALMEKYKHMHLYINTEFIIALFILLNVKF